MWHHNLEDNNLNLHCCKNIKFPIVVRRLHYKDSLLNITSNKCTNTMIIFKTMTKKIKLSQTVKFMKTHFCYTLAHWVHSRGILQAVGSYTADQEISCCYGTWRFVTAIRSLLSQLNSVCSSKTILSKVHFNNIIPSKPRPTKYSHSMRLIL